MSVFTHHPFYTVPDNDFGNFGGLVRFIDDWDKHFSKQGGSRQARRNVQTFTPRFDVKETDQNYELHGELPGVEKKDVSIEFSDLQTIVIRGNVQRTYTAGTPPAGLLGDTAMSGAIANEPHNDDSETRSNKSFQATVEDDKEEGAKSNTATSGAVVESSKPETPAEPQQEKHKFWVYERSVGNFSRSFTFSSLVDHANVSASLDNGILTVVVPKAKKPDTRRIAIN
ncbi:30 kDa heat shock protein [Hypoxylon argillaceum]|nr:30 kDa heat shock protein [Hypoxylon argillaceum]